MRTDPSDSATWGDLSVQSNKVGNSDAMKGRVTDRIQTHSGDSLTIDTGDVKATLIGVPQVRIDDLVYTHHRRRLNSSTRPCALFEVKNIGEVPVNWTSRQTKFIGSDGYTYKQSHISLDPSQIGPGCYSSQIEIEPGCRARIITPVEQLPPTVDVAQVIHRVGFRGQLARQRLTYTL